MRKRDLINAHQIFINDPGGTGKSHIIDLLHRDVINFIEQTKQIEPDDLLVLLTVSTGSAAFNIR